MIDEPRPTLDDLRKQLESGFFGHRPSRYGTKPCPVCKKEITTNALGRESHMGIHRRSGRLKLK